MASDAVYMAEVIDAVLAELTGHLPTNWFPEPAHTSPPTYTEQNPDPHYAWETPLALLEHGDLLDYPAEPEGVMLDCPAILVKPLGVQLVETEGGVGGVEVYSHGVRVVHLRGWEQCWDGSGNQVNNQTRARARYAKAIHAAVFADAYGMMGSPTLTGVGSAEAVVNVTFDGWDFRGTTEDVAIVRDLRAHLWAIALDLQVWVRATP